MSSPLVLPFNFQPVAVSVRTASYTIPPGRYARVVVNLEGSATFTIGGVTALRGTQNNVLSSSNTQMSGTAPTQLAINSSAGTGTAAFGVSASQKVLIADLWLPAGTVISGTGTWRAVVQEFNNLS